jgi:MFS family permease
MVAAGIALAAALLIGTPWAYIAACVVIGLGVATLFPAAMHAATQIPGVRPAMGVATVGWLARGGFVLAPVAVGAIAERYGIAWGLTVPILAAALLVPLSTILRPRSAHPIP